MIEGIVIAAIEQAREKLRKPESGIFVPREEFEAAVRKWFGCEVKPAEPFEQFDPEKGSSFLD